LAQAIGERGRLLAGFWEEETETLRDARAVCKRLITILCVISVVARARRALAALSGPDVFSGLTDALPPVNTCRRPEARAIVLIHVPTGGTVFGVSVKKEGMAKVGFRLPAELLERAKKHAARLHEETGLDVDEYDAIRAVLAKHLDPLEEPGKKPAKRRSA
jgi:hypothetical protein